MSPRLASTAVAVALEARPRPLGRPRSEDCRQRILAAARDLLEERGLRALTMEAIAERAGTSKVTLYRWWSHKAAVVMDAMLAEVSPQMPYRDAGSPLGSLADQMKSFSRFLGGRPGRLLRGVLAEGVLDADVGDALREHWVKPRRDDARVLLQRAIEAGELTPELDLDVLLDALFGPLYHRLLVTRAPLTPAVAGAVFQTVMAGAATKKGRAHLGL